MIAFFTLLFNLLFVFSVFAQTPLQNCKDESCLRTAVPYDSKSPPSLESCKVLDGKKSSADFDEDLGTLCRLVVSRAMAGKRPNDACSFDPNNITPDWDNDLKQKSLLKYYNQTLALPVYAKNSIAKLSNTHGTNNSTIHGSYVYDDQSQEAEGKKRGVTFATYFCIGQNPKHYTPYFWSLKVDQKVVDQGYVATPPQVEKVLLQENPFNGFMEGETVADLNGDGHKDSIQLEKDIFKGYRPLVCLYQPNQPQCYPISTEDFVKIDEMFVKAKIVNVGSKQIKVEFSKDGKVLSDAVYEYSGNSLKLKK